MPYRTSATQCVVRLIPLRRLSPATLAQCAALRQKAGRCWMDLVASHQQARQQAQRQGQWLGGQALEQLAASGEPAGPYALHSQPLQALAQQLDANLATATTMRPEEGAQGDGTEAVTTQYPYHPKRFPMAMWKDQTLRMQAGSQLWLSKVANRAPFVLPPPEECDQADLRRTALTWQADHFALCLTLDTGHLLSL